MRRRRVGGLAERAVERGGELRRVGHDRGRLGEAGVVERARGWRRRGRPSCRTGAIRSAPARACATAMRPSSGSVASLSDVAVGRRARRSGRGRCTGRGRRRWRSTSSGARRGCARIASGTGPASSHALEPSIVLRRRQAEQQHAADAGLGCPLRLRGGLVGRHVRDARQGLQGPAHAAAGHDEEGQDELGGIEGGLADETPEALAPAQAPGAGDGKRQRGSWSRTAAGSLARFVDGGALPATVDRRGALHEHRRRSPTSAPVIRVERGPARSDEGAEGLSPGATRRGPPVWRPAPPRSEPQPPLRRTRRPRRSSSGDSRGTRRSG